MERLKVINLADVPPKRYPKSGTKWGPWEYVARNCTLWNADNDYEIDLERIHTSAQCLDWICQIGWKVWATPEITGHLVHAFNDLIHPQETLCSLGNYHVLENYKEYRTKKQRNE